MPTDSELLRQYVRDGSEAAFTELVHRYGALVYSAALRSSGGQGHLAEEVTQDVFILLARKAPLLVRHEALAGWLHTTTRHVTLRALHRQRQRDVREQEALAMQTLSPPEVPWEQLRPLLDEAVGQLNDSDRNAVLLRYFQGWSHREVGAALGLNEDAARVRTERAVEKLRHYFARSGVATSAALLAEALSANTVSAAPSGLLGQVAATSFAHGQKLGLGHALLRALYMTTNTKIIVTAAVLGAAFAAGWSGSDFAAKHTSSPVKSAFVKNVPLSPVDALAKARADLARILRIPGTFDRDRALDDYMEKLDAAMVKALITDLLNKPLSTDNNGTVSLLSYRWAELEPEAALVWLQALQDKGLQSLCAGQIFDAYSAKDPAAALSTLAKLSADFNVALAGEATMDNFVRQDPQAALAALQALPQNLPHRDRLEGDTLFLFLRWAEIDPASAAAAALQQSGGVSGTMLSLQRIASTWAEQDPAAALAWAGSLPGGQPRNGATYGALDALSQQDPAAAANYFLNLPSDTNSGSLLQVIANNWAQADPSALLTWAASNLTGTAFDTAAKAALNQMSNSEPAAAAAYLAQNLDADVVKQVAPALASNWAQQNPQTALAWAQSLPADNPAARNSAINGVFTGWTNTNPAAAAAYIQQNLASDPSFSTLAAQVVKSWGSADPQAALNWAQNLPSGDAQNNAVVTAITALAKVEPQAAAATAAQNALGSLTDLTVAQQTALQNIVGKAANP